MTTSEAEANRATHEWLFGADPLPGIVSVWAARDGRAIIWRREGSRLVVQTDRFRPWIYAATLDDVQYLQTALAAADLPTAARAQVTYHDWGEQPAVYRYLLSARPGVALEGTLLRGASRRLGRQIKHLHDLGDNYYGVGPVEQYLMTTGRVAFRGLEYAELHRLQFDLETTALDPREGRIFLVAIADSRGFRQVLEAPQDADEARLIADLATIIRERDPDVIENHNLHGFDLPFLIERATRLRVPLHLGRAPLQSGLEYYADPRGGEVDGRRRMRASIPGRELIDTLDAVWRYDFAARDLPSHGLKQVAIHFGIARPGRVYIPGAAVWSTYGHDPERVREYALDDVLEVDALSQRLLGAAFVLAGMAPRRYERVASAGPAMGILEPILVRAYLQAGASLPYGRPSSGNAHAGGSVELFATGVAEHVVKADVASLYPSLMRTYRIGPRCDMLGVLLGILGQLTDLRLEHKAAMHTAPPGSLAAGRHAATQAAMKILINAAYGYMGAPSMALFADQAAADEVTRRGREVLAQIVAALRSRGMALIEADTDGVYFAVPQKWSAEQEQALVGAVAAELPAGIRLEYEGRYQAMFSHEVKNYALLRYDGTLITRGVAFRSSRAEPFGARFLHAALHALLRGDVAGVREVYLQTIAALRAGTVPVSDLAARIRATKSAPEYLAARPHHPEPVYEALLQAGRNEWKRGERVHFYRAPGKRLVIVPDDADEAPPTDLPAYDVEYYANVLLHVYCGRLRKAFDPRDFDQLFRLDQQLGLFDRPVDHIQPIRITCEQ